MNSTSIKFASQSDFSAVSIDQQLNFVSNYKDKNKDSLFVSQFQALGISCVPYTDKKLVLVFKEDDFVGVEFDTYVSALFEAGIDIYAAAYADYNKSVNGVKNQRFKYLANGQKYALDVATNEILETAICVKAGELSSLFTGFFASQLNLLSKDKLAEAAFILACGGIKTPIGITLDDLKLTITDGSRGLSISFETGILTVMQSANTFLASSMMNLGGFNVSGSSILAILAMELCSLVICNEAYKMKGIVSSISSLWDDSFSNYGVSRDLTTPSHLIKTECAHQVSAAFEVDVRTALMLPLFMGVIYTGDFDLTQAKDVVASGQAMITDKTGKQFIGGDFAAAAAGMCRIKTKGFGSYSDKEYDVQITPHDLGNKLNKKTNVVHMGGKACTRPTQGMKSNAANAYKNNWFKENARLSSAYKNKLPDGRIVSQKGIEIDILATDGGINFGSGSVLINPDTWMFVGVNKTNKGRVAVNMLSEEMMIDFEIGTAKGFAAFFADVKEKVEALFSSDKVYAPGEVIFAYDFGGRKPKTILVNNTHNQHMRLTGAVEFIVPPVQGNYQPAYFNINLGVEVVSSTQYAKWRNQGIKATTQINKTAKFFDADGNDVGFPVDAVFNLETMKGKSAHLTMFASVNGDVVNNNDGTLTWYKNDGSGDEVTWNALAKYNPVQAWVKANTKKMSMFISIPQAEWDIMRDCGADAHTEVVAQHEGYVDVVTTFNALQGKIWVEYEISTADESVSISSFTPEMTSGLYLQFPRLAEEIVRRSIPRRAKVFDLVNMAAKVYDKKTTPVFDLNTVDSAKKFTEALNLESIISISDRDLISKLAVIFPQGVVFRSVNEYSTFELFIDFKVVGHSMTFISGSADQISQEIVSLVRWLTVAKNHLKPNFITSWKSAVNKLSTGLSEWLFGALLSKGLMKNAGRTADFLVNGKVRTTYDLELQPDADGVPKLMINPSCGMARLLAKDENGKYIKKYTRLISKDDHMLSLGILPLYCDQLGVLKDGSVLLFDPYLLQGEFVGAVRVPMYMMAGCKLVISTAHEKSYAALLPSVWAMTNHGDTDGDNIGVINLSSFGVTLEEVIAMNESICGMAAYEALFGPDKKKWPYADFVERPMKKLLAWDTQEDEDKYLVPYFSAVPLTTTTDFPFPFHEPETTVTHIGYYENTECVHQHYKSAVGIGYGIASALTFMATNMVTTNDKRADLYKFALSIMWALVYEGLGLSGYTPEAKNWFDILRAAAPTMTNSKHFGKYAVDTDGSVISVFDKKVMSDNLPVHSAIDVLGHQFPMSHVSSKKMDWAMAKVLEVENIRRHFSKIESGRVDYTKAKKEVIPPAMVYGALRRMGQGADPAALNHDASIDEYGQNSGMSLFQSLSKYKYHEAEIKTPWLLAMVDEAIELHSLAGKFIKRKNDAMNNNY